MSATPALSLSLSLSLSPCADQVVDDAETNRKMLAALVTRMKVGLGLG